MMNFRTVCPIISIPTRTSPRDDSRSLNSSSNDGSSDRSSGAGSGRIVLELGLHGRTVRKDRFSDSFAERLEQILYT